MSSINLSEIRLINAAWRGPTGEGWGEVFRSGIRPEMLQSGECQSVYEWVLDKHTRFGKWPSETMVKQNFPNMTRQKVLDPLPMLIEEFKTYYRAVLVQNALEAQVANHQLGDFDGILADMRQGVSEVDAFTKDDSTTLRSGDEDALNRILDENAARDGSEVIPTGYPTIDKALDGGLRKGQLDVIIAPTKAGKAESVHEPVLTPDGWVEIGQLKVGDRVVSVDGTPTEVLGVYPQGIRPLYRVTTDDGGSVVADVDHLWEVTSKHGSTRVLTTLEVAERLERSGAYSSYLPMPKAPEMTAQALPVDPWLVGALIGDGSYSSGVSITSADSGVLAEVSRIHGLPLVPKKGDPYTFGISTPRGQKNPLVDGLRALGIYGQSGQSKRLPEGWELWSADQRLALLQGLMDTDGWFQNGRSCLYSSAVEEVSLGVQQLVWSLGGTARVKRKPRSYTLDGVRHAARDAYEVSLRLGHSPFRVSEKAAKFEAKVSKTRRPTRRIISVERVEDGEAVCIRVAHPRALYVTKDYIVTHNTTFALQLAIAAQEAGHKVVFQTYELSERQVFLKYLSQSLRITPKSLEEGKLRPSQEAKVDEMLTRHEDGDIEDMIFVSYVRDIPTAAVAVEQESPDMLVIDGAYMMEVAEKENRTNSLEAMLRGLKALALQQNIAVVVTTQALESKMTGNQLKQTSAAHSSAWGQYADVMLGLQRVDDPTGDRGESLPDERLLRILLNRFGDLEEVPLEWSWGNLQFGEL